MNNKAEALIEEIMAATTEGGLRYSITEERAKKIARRCAEVAREAVDNVCVRVEPITFGKNKYLIDKGKTMDEISKAFGVSDEESRD